MTPEALMIYCPCCAHLYSKRATKCPKCNWPTVATCGICKTQIPAQSKACPECGDPDPFGSSTGLLIETPAPASLNQKRETPIQKRTDTSDELTASPEDRKKMNQFLRWAIIIGSWLGLSIIVALIQDLLGKPLGRTPEEASIIAMLFYGVPALTPIFIWYMTRTKK